MKHRCRCAARAGPRFFRVKALAGRAATGPGRTRSPLVLYIRTAMPPDRFRCPICRSTLYTVVKVQGASGQWRATSLLECLGCSVVFRDPLKLTAFDPNGYQQAGVPHAPDPPRRE